MAMARPMPELAPVTTETVDMARNRTPPATRQASWGRMLKGGGGHPPPPFSIEAASDSAARPAQGEQRQTAGQDHEPHDGRGPGGVAGGGERRNRDHAVVGVVRR